MKSGRAPVEIDCGFPLKGDLLAPPARAINIEAVRSVTVEIATDAILVMAGPAAG
jgi:hypothetical protein